MIAVDAVHVKEVQQFITYADPYETVGGTWSMTYPGEGNTHRYRLICVYGAQHRLIRVLAEIDLNTR